MAVRIFTLAVAACLVAAVAAQAPAPGPALAFGALPPTNLVQQMQEPAYQSQRCIKGLDMVTSVYTYTGSWAKVPQLPFIPQGNPAIPQGIVCYTVPGASGSALDMQNVFHWSAQVGGKSVKQLVDAQLAAQVSFEQLLSAIRVVEGRDNSYWSTITQVYTAVNFPFVSDIHFLGNVIYGKTAEDQNLRYWCGCILRTTQALDANGQNVTKLPELGSPEAATSAAISVAQASG